MRARFVWLALVVVVFMTGTRSLLAVEAAVAENPAVSSKGEKPNVLIFITDDESWLERQAYGWTNVPTPNFDRVAKAGVLFTQGFASAPSCAPSRAAFLTGRNFWELEQGAFIQAWLPEKFPVLPDLLKSAGYRTGRIGKGWGPGVYPEGAHGKNSAGPVEHQVKVRKPQKFIYPMDYAASFEKFLAESPGDQPFYYWAGVTEPHDPVAPDNYKKLKEKYNIDWETIPVPGFLPDTPAIRRGRANIIYEICYADEQLGRMLDMLEQRGQLDNTLVIVTSDNGTACAHSKASSYDWGVHVPLTIMWPAAVPADRVVEDFVTLADMAPTIMEAVNGQVPEEMSGRSLLAILRSAKSGQVEPSRDHVVTGLEWHGELPPMNRAGRTIRDKRYAYIVNYGNLPGLTLNAKSRLPDDQFAQTAEKAGLTQLMAAHPEHPTIAPFVALYTKNAPSEELYDLEKDPWQMNNLIDDPAHAEIRERLKKQLHEYQLKTHDPRVTGDMKIFNETRAFVEKRKSEGYSKSKSKAGDVE